MSIDVTKQTSYNLQIPKPWVVSLQAAYVLMPVKDMLFSKQTAYVLYLPKSERKRRRTPLIVN